MVDVAEGRIRAGFNRDIKKVLIISFSTQAEVAAQGLVVTGHQMMAASKAHVEVLELVRSVRRLLCEILIKRLHLAVQAIAEAQHISLRRYPAQAQPGLQRSG